MDDRQAFAKMGERLAEAWHFVADACDHCTYQKPKDRRGEEACIKCLKLHVLGTLRELREEHEARRAAVYGYVPNPALERGE